MEEKEYTVRWKQTLMEDFVIVAESAKEAITRVFNGECGDVNEIFDNDLQIIKEDGQPIINVKNSYPEYIVKNVRQYLGYDENDTSHDEEINQMDADSIFEKYLAWEGILGYEQRLKRVALDLYK